MHRLLASTVLAAFLPACFAGMAGAQTASLGTAQTILRLKAGTNAPQLLSVQAPDKALWSNQAAEDLIATAEVDGHSVPLHWKLIANAQQRNAKHIAFVYETQSPHLRLTWEWSAPAATGPARTPHPH